MKKILSLFLALSLTEPVWCALSFITASSMSVATTSPGVPGTGALTVSLWFKTTSVAGASTNGIFSFGGGASGTQFYLACESGVLWFRAAGGNTANAGTGYNDGNWHHFIFTKTSGAGVTVTGVNFYVDGVLLSKTTAGASALNFATTLPVSFGDNSISSTAFYSGQLDDIRLYNRILSGAEITSLAKSRIRLPLTDGLVGWWKMDEGKNGVAASGSGSILDISLNHSNGTPSNGPTGAPSSLSYP